MSAETQAVPRLALTLPEAAQACGVSEDTITRAGQSGALRRKRTGKNGGKFLYTIAALGEWLDGLDEA